MFKIIFQILRGIRTEFVELLQEAFAAANRKIVLLTLGIAGLGGFAAWYGLTHIDPGQAMEGVIRMQCSGGRYSDAWIGGILIAFFTFGVSSVMFVGEMMVLQQRKKTRRPASPVLAIGLGMVVLSSFGLGLYSALSC